MTRVWLASLALAGCGCASAFAADVPTKAPVHKTVPAAVFDWSGFYLGVHAGYGWGDKDWRDSVSFNVSGAITGGQIGFNHQIGNVVLGVEADLSWSNVKGDIIAGIGPSASLSESNLHSIAMLTGRVGYAFGPWLGYLKAGAAWARETHTVTVIAGPVTGFATGTETRLGWTVGGGIEYALLNNWSAKVEYSYIGFGEKTVPIAGTIGGIPFTGSVSPEQKIHLAKVGLNYRFGGAAPAFAPAPFVSTGVWTGVHVGVHAAYGWAHKVWPTATTGGDPIPSYTANGFLGGGQIGFDIQRGDVVFGLEAEVSGGRLHSNQTLSLLGGVLVNDYATRIDWLGTFTGRLGFVFEQWLIYGKGGVAWAVERHAVTTTVPVSLVVNAREIRTGWTIGAGIERALGDNWSMKLEYNYIDFGKEFATFTGVIPAGFVFFPFRIDQTMHVVKIGLNYKFGAATGTLAAKG